MRIPAKRSQNNVYHKIFIGSLMFAFVMIAVFGGLSAYFTGTETAPPAEGQVGVTNGTSDILIAIPLVLGGLGILVALFAAIVK